MVYPAAEEEVEILDPETIQPSIDLSQEQDSFTKYLQDEKDPINQDGIFHWMNTIYTQAQREVHFHYLLQQLTWIQHQHLDIYEELSGYLVDYGVNSAFLTGQLSRIPSILSAVNPVKFPDEFSRIQEMLLFYGDQDAIEALLEVMERDWGEMNDTSQVMEWSREEYGDVTAALIILTQLQKDPHCNPLDLLHQIQPYTWYPVHEELLLENILTPLQTGREVLLKTLSIGQQKEPDERFYNSLKWSSCKTWSDACGVSLERSLLAANILLEYIFLKYEQSGDMETALLPDAESIKEFLNQQAGFLFSQPWKMASFMAIVPDYVYRLSEAQIISLQKKEDLFSQLFELCNELLVFLLSYAKRNGLIYFVLAKDLQRLYLEVYALSGA